MGGVVAQQKSDQQGSIGSSPSATDTINNDYATLLKEYEAGKRDSAFLRNLTIIADGQNDKKTARNIANVYISQITFPYADQNIKFICRYTYATTDTGFHLLFNNQQKVNSLAGKNTAEAAIKRIIAAQEIEPHLVNKTQEPDWNKIAASVSRFGVLGMEKLYGTQMIYYYEKKDWKNFGKYFNLYYQTAYDRSEFHINNLSWSIFEHVKDTAVLKAAVKVLGFSIQHFDQSNANAHDTYANLLHKCGNTSEAIKWEEKALRMDPNDRWKQEVLMKMKAGRPTWPDAD
jgi:tetratricopeptide (TPR) repeat protein